MTEKEYIIVTNGCKLRIVEFILRDIIGGYGVDPDDLAKTLRLTRKMSDRAFFEIEKLKIGEQ